MKKNTDEAIEKRIEKMLNSVGKSFVAELEEIFRKFDATNKKLERITKQYIKIFYTNGLKNAKESVKDENKRKC